MTEAARRRWLVANPALRVDQSAPPTAWRTWLLMGGRGSGKTLAGAWWINRMAGRGRPTLALVGPTFHDVREVMVEGPSGIRALSLEPTRWEAGRRRLVWDNGAVAYAFSAEDPDSLRGPQFHGAWCDELCAWKDPQAVLDNLRMGLRLGDDPRMTITTTPRPIPALRRLLSEAGVAVSRMATRDNLAHLAPGFLDNLTELYGGTRLEAQELDGLMVEPDGALFRAEDLKRARGNRPVAFDAVVVAVDPPASAGGDACGIVVAGRRERMGYVLDDRSARGLSPIGWGRRVAEACDEHAGATVVAEVNQGGDMVRAVLAQAGCTAPIVMVHATRAKRVRAEPIAALYEQGRIVHCGAFPALEEELMSLGAEGHRASPDRADALVWAMTQLMLGTRAGPRVRGVMRGEWFLTEAC